MEEKASIGKALITHWHHDHVNGIPDLLEVFPETKICKNEPDAGQLDITDGQKFMVEGATLTAMHTPGHTGDHMVFLLEEEDAMFTADTVLGHGTAVFEDLGAYLASLEKMRTRFKGRAYPGHGAVLEDGPAKISEYIHHRRHREEQVIQTLKSSKPEVSTSDDDSGDWDVMELVRVIYKNVPESLHLPAAGGVIQVLQKLENEGKVVEEDGRWRLKNRSPL